MPKVITLDEIKRDADAINRAGKVDFLARCIAAGMTIEQVKAAMESGKRRHTGIIQSDVSTIQTAAAFSDVTLTFPQLDDGTRLILGVGIVIDADGTPIPDGVMEQLEKLFTLKAVRTSGSSSEYSLGGYLLGPAAAEFQGYTATSAFAKRVATLANLIHSNARMPMDAVPSTKQFKLEISGGTGTTPLESFSDVVNITAFAIVEDLMNAK